ncbi:5-methylcytosine restriction system specificity protein McrC [Agrococcus sp. DT81.2]|uniref:5-methylcytosine restriction system specificity protein McrC n=1 Tax=Agrococcus sp. DT81.2 TaxID=3393414 RepID=UPI003CE5A62F
MTLAVKASPNGSRAGFALLRDGSDTGVLTVTVLPKPWATKGESSVARCVEHQPGGVTHVVVHELDVLEIVTDPGAAQALAFAVAELADDVEEEGPVQRRLLEVGRRVTGATARRASLDPSFESVLSLLNLTQHVRASRLDQAIVGRYSSSVLRILEQRQFVLAVEQAILTARPRYEERTEELAVPRGRIHERGLLLSEWSKVPRVTSTFDELTLNTPILQVVAATLRLTASDRHDAAFAALVGDVRHRAARLLQLLQGTSVLDAGAALRLLESIVVSSLDQPWSPVLRLAQPVLRRLGLNPQGGGHVSHSALAITLRMEKVWEEWLELAFPAGWEVLPQAPTSAPWAKDPNIPRLSSNADFLVRTDDGAVVVVDAKYKIDTGYISSSDGYQLFAYSHLARLNGDLPQAAAIFYPLLSDDSKDEAGILWRAFGSTFPLWRVGLPFAGRSETRSRAAFADYLVRLRSEIEEKIRGSREVSAGVRC